MDSVFDMLNATIGTNQNSAKKIYLEIQRKLVGIYNHYIVPKI